MEMSLNKQELAAYIGMQLEHFFPDKNIFRGRDVEKAIDLGLERLEYCYKFIAIPAYCRDGQTYFSHLHGDQYSQFLYYLSNSLWSISANKPICDKIIQLNRLLSGCFYSYNSGLPDIFYWSHPVGTVLGKAKYGNFFSCRQNCTVATQKSSASEKNEMSFGKGLFLGAGASIMSHSIKIGDRVAIGTGTMIYNADKIEDDMLIYNKEGKMICEKRDRDYYNKRMTIWNVEV